MMDSSKLRFLADENIPLEAVILLRNKIDIVSVSEIAPGIDDESVLAMAVKEKRILVTFDSDFGELIFRIKKKSCGVILLQIIPQTVEYIFSTLKKVLSQDVDFSKSFCVVESHKIRVIKLD